MKSLVLFTALLLVGCSVEVAHEAENKSQTESLLTSDKSKTGVSVGILEVPEASPESQHTESATSSIERSTTIVKVIVPEPTPELVISPPPIVHCPDRSIQISGSDNIVVLGDLHVHHHEHKQIHLHKTPKPTPVRVEVRVELGDRIGEREWRRRMVERRISNVFPHYRD